MGCPGYALVFAGPMPSQMFYSGVIDFDLETYAACCSVLDLTAR
jgi:hypothetical protein